MIGTPYPHAPAGALPPWSETLFWAVIAAGLLGVGMGSPTGVTGLDEYWHTMRTALESLETHSWIIPVLDDQPRVEKPPLLYWLIMGSFVLFGETYWSARLPVLCLGVLLVLVMRDLGHSLLRGEGSLVALMTLATAAIMVESRRAILDLPVLTCTALVLWAVLNTPSRDGRLWWIIAAVAAAAGVMFKGPAILIFLFTAAVAAYWRPPLADWQSDKSAVVLAAVVFIVLTLAWPIAVLWSVPDVFERLQSDLGDRQFALPGLDSLLKPLTSMFVITLPWGVLLLSSFVWAQKDTPLADRRLRSWLKLWLILSLLPFFFINTFERYLLPALVPAILLVASHYQNLVECHDRRVWSPLVLLSLPSALIFLFDARFFGIEIAGMLAMILLLLIAWWVWERRPRATVGGLSVVLALALGVVYPRFGVNQIPSSIQHQVSETMPSVAHYASAYPGTLSMSLGRSVPFIEREDYTALRQLAEKNGLLILRQEDVIHLDSAIRTARFEHEVVGQFRMFYARGAFLKFARPGLQASDWLQAWSSQSLETLKPEFLLIRLSPVPDSDRQEAA